MSDLEELMMNLVPEGAVFNCGVVVVQFINENGGVDYGVFKVTDSVPKSQVLGLLELVKHKIAIEWLSE